MLAHLGYLRRISAASSAPLYICLGLIALWQRRVPFLREWAYAGYFFDLVGAFASHGRRRCVRLVPVGVGASSSGACRTPRSKLGMGDGQPRSKSRRRRNRRLKRRRPGHPGRLSVKNKRLAEWMFFVARSLGCWEEVARPLVVQGFRDKKRKSFCKKRRKRWRHVHLIPPRVLGKAFVGRTEPAVFRDQIGVSEGGPGLRDRQVGWGALI